MGVDGGDETVQLQPVARTQRDKHADNVVGQTGSCENPAGFSTGCVVDQTPAVRSGFSLNSHPLFPQMLVTVEAR